MTQASTMPMVQASVPVVVKTQEQQERTINPAILAELTKQIKETKAASQNLESGLTEIDAVYRTKHPKLIGELHDLTQHLSLLQHMREEAAKKARKQESEQSDANPKATSDDMVKAVAAAQKKLKKRVTRLYRRLNNLCHPDKIRSVKYDPIRYDLTNFFMEGKQAYLLFDFVTLSMIHAQVVALREKIGEATQTLEEEETESLEDAYNLFMEERGNLERQLTAIVMGMNNLANSILFSVLKLHIDKNQAAASNVYRGLLIKKIEGLKEEINLATTSS